MSTNEKLPLAQPPAAPRPHRRPWLRVLPAAVAGLWLYSLASHTSVSRWGPDPSHAELEAARCPQVEPLVPAFKTSKLDDMDEFIAGPKFRNETVDRLAGAVRIPTVSFDNMGEVGDDDRWDIMFEFSAYLEKTFPAIHSSLKLDKINTHGLLYTWQGSDESLKPSVLMAHQDVVPVAEATIGQWEHPPFSGDFDGTSVWGRGSMDCKNTLIGIMEAVEKLLDAGFEPKRTLILSFGFDEEISGHRGAKELSAALLERYGKDGIASIVDEGAGIMPGWGTYLALPGVAEKGYIDVNFVVRLPGGHSSVPAPHTGIGVASELIALIEANPYESKLHPENPYLSLLQCGAAHAPEFPKKLKKLLPSPHSSRHNTCSKKKGKLEREAAKGGDAIKYLFTTSQAVDIINGGVKANALPERTTFLVNHRVNIGESPDDVKAKITKLAKTVADKYNLTLNAFNDAEETPNSISIFTDRNVLEVAPVTPTSIDSTTPYSVLSGTTRGLYGKDIIVSPGLMTGNTDTRYYWDLTRHIFRYAPGWDTSLSVLDGIHTVNERATVQIHVRTVQWFSLFVRNLDEANLA